MWIKLINFLRWCKLKLFRLAKRYSPKTLFSRSMVILVTPLVLTLGIGLFVFFDRHWSTTTINLTNSLAGEIAMVSETWDKAPDQHTREALLARAFDTLGLYIYYTPEKAYTDSARLSLPGIHNALDQALRNKLGRKFIIRPYKTDDKSQIIISVTVQDGVLNVIIPEKRLFSTTTYVFLLIMIGSGLLLSVVAVAFMRNQIRPVHRLAIVAEQFGKGIDAPFFRPSGAKEVRQAAHAFLEMRERIKRQIRQRTDMLSGVSHDLRTPLTRMKLQLAMLPENSDTQAMQNDIQAMERMIKAYLDFAKDETMERSLRCNILDILHQCIHDSVRQGLIVTYDNDQDALAMSLRPQAMRRVFANLLENARLYADKVWITVNQLSRSVEIMIDDDGPGIPEELYEDVFKPFHRVDESRNQDIEGTGLGMTIARDIVQSHGGTISLGTSPYGGLRVTIWLPL